MSALITVGAILARVGITFNATRSIVGVGTAGSTPGAFNPNTGTITTNVNSQSTTIIADAVLRERHDDETIMTDHPVEQGAVITDHAYAAPSELELTYGWALGSTQNLLYDPAFLKSIYQQLLNLRVSRTLCTVNTGKRIYKNMLIRRIVTESDQYNESILIVIVSLREVLLATLQTAPAVAPQNQQAIPQTTAPIVNQGGVTLQSAPNFNPSGAP
jgi:hypothetical protein